MATSADCIFVHASSRSLPSTSISSSDVNLPPMVRINDELTKVDEKISSKYSLKDIVDNFELKKNQKAKERYHRKRKRKDEEDKEDEEDHFLNYAILKDWLEEKCKCRQRYDDIVLTDSNVEVFLNLEPIFCSVKIRPDLVMYRHDPKIPVLIVEVVHSSPYARSLRKLALVLVEQLRYLRNGNIDLFKWTGFCFPKASPPSCVTEMTVVWNSNDLVFEVNCSFLQLDDVKSRIQGVFFTQKTTSFNIPRRLMGFPLNRKDLIFGFGKDAYQIRSKSSIIVCDGKFFYKHIVDNFESRAIEEMIAVDEKSDKYLLPSKKYSYRKGPCFYVYPKLLSPMSRAEAKRCLPNFVTSVAKAINALHTTLERAHLDIRLENVCFSEKFEAVLIDLDRATKINVKVPAVRYKTGVMYNPPEPQKWTTEMLDWLQLGYVIAFCYQDDVTDYHKMTVCDELMNDNFVHALMQGEYNGSYLDNSSIIRQQGKTYEALEEVLKSRDGQRQPSPSTKSS